MNAISNVLSSNPGTTQSSSLQPGAPGFSAGGLTLSSVLPAATVNPPSFGPTLQESLFTFNSAAYGINPNLVSPYIQNWNFSVQREIAHGTVFEARYLGNKSTHAWHYYNKQETNIFENGFLSQFIQAQQNLAINQAAGVTSFANRGLPGQGALPIFEAAFGALGSQSALAASSGFANGTFITNLQQGVAGTLANSLAGNSTYLCRLAGSSFSPCAKLGYNVPGAYPSNLFNPNPYVTNLNYQDDDAYSTYNSLQLDLRRSFSHGLTLNANYTWSHALSNLFNASDQTAASQERTLRNGRLNYGPTPFDVRQALQTYWTYNLPIGKGQLVNISNTILDRIVGGWGLGAVWRFASGHVIQMTSGRNTVNTNTSLNTLATAGSGVILNGITLSQLQTDLNTVSGYSAAGRALIGNTSIIAANGTANSQYILPASTPGVFGQFLYLYGPSLISMDMSLSKEIKVKERLRVAFQLEALNFLNHPVFNIGNVNVTSTSFGQITTTQIGPRNVQLRAYIQF
jgi:hypothetical protein